VTARPSRNVFLSAVGHEFGHERAEVYRDLVEMKFQVHGQEELLSTGSALLLTTLRDRIRECDTFVMLIGRESGAVPSDEAAAPFLHLLPPGIVRASYTQWEFFFAEHYGLRRLLFRHAVSLNPGDSIGANADRDELQVAFIRYLEWRGPLFSVFSTAHELCRHVLLGVYSSDPAAARPIVLPFPSLGTLFKGRTFSLRHLGDLLAAGHLPGQTIVSPVAVCGTGGIGKTRLAVEYAWSHRDDYSALILLDSETPDRLESSLAALAGPLQLVEDATTETEVKAEAAIDWLNRNPGWLLILDNVDTSPALEAVRLLLYRLRDGHAVLTSRMTQFPSEIVLFTLDVLGPEDAAAFLTEASAIGRMVTSNDATQARDLADELGQLPLALEMAAATIDARHISFAAYRTLWESNRSHVVGWTQPGGIDFRRTMAAKVRASTDRVTAAGRLLLEYTAFLAPDPLPVFLLDGMADGEAALSDLLKYSMATRDTAPGSFLVHRLVQEVTRQAQRQAGTERERVGQALAWVDAAFVGDPRDVRNWGILEPLAPHAVAVVGFADAAGAGDSATRLMNELGTLFLTQALHSRAEPLLRRALAIDEASYGDAHPAVARDLNNLAGLLQATNRLGEAEPLMRRALAIDEASYGDAHPNVAIRLNNLAQLMQATNRMGEAEPLMRRALAIDDASYGDAHPDVAISLNNLATLLQATNRLGEAEPLMRRALAIDERYYGADHPTVARDLNNLSVLLKATHRVEEAEPIMRRMVLIVLAFQGESGYPHPQRDTAWKNYQILLQELGQSDTEIDEEMRTVQREAGLV
jgi:tetratricopeptide (TPR) repeat protein